MKDPGAHSPGSRVKRILLVPGWSGDASIWDRLVEAFSLEGSPFACHIERVDPGYYAPPSHPDLSIEFDLGVGHSAGLQWLLQKDTLRCRALLSICGFTRFVREDDFPAGWPRRVLDRMIRQLQADPEGCLREFHEKGGLSEIGEPAFYRQTEHRDGCALAAGLQALSISDCRTQWSCFQGPRAVLAATDDPIVDANLTLSCFADEEIEWIPARTHWLPMTHPHVCATMVRKLLTRLDERPVAGNPT